MPLNIDQMKQQGWQDIQPLAPMPIKTNPYKHQILGFNIGISIPNVALLMEMRTGKTLTSIAIMGHRFTQGQIKRVLIVAPSSVVPVWEEQIEQHAFFSTAVRVLDGSVALKTDQIYDFAYCDRDRREGLQHLQIAVVNYESLWRMIPQDQRRRWRVDKSCFNEWTPDMIICDESQRIKTPSTNQSRALHNLGRLAKYRMILTGTPVTQSPLDFYSQYRFLEPTLLEPSYYAFRNKYAIMGGYQNYQVVGYKNLPELVSKVHSIAFRCTQEECLDLPETIDQNLYCELEPDAQRKYKQLLKESIAELEQGRVLTAPNVLAKLLRLSQLAGGFLVAGDNEERVTNVSKAKLDLLKETLEDVLATGKKVVIFARFLPEIKAICIHLGSKGIKFCCMTGATPVPERKEMQDAFLKPDGPQVFVSQIMVGREGINLASADTMIFYSYDFNFGNYDQARSRIIHPEKKNGHCAYIHLVAKGTVDEKILRALKDKQGIAESVVDNWRDWLEVV